MKNEIAEQKPGAEELVSLTFDVPAYVRTAIEAEGKKDERKRAAMARKILTDWAKGLGYKPQE